MLLFLLTLLSLGQTCEVHPPTATVNQLIPRAHQGLDWPIGRASSQFSGRSWVATASDAARVFIYDERSRRTLCSTAVVGEHPTDACQQDPASMADGGAMVKRWCGTYPEWLTDVQVSPDDSLLVATGIAGSLAVWRTSDFQRLTLDAEGVRPSRLEGAAFSPDNRFLAVAGDYGDFAVRVYDLHSGHAWLLPTEKSNKRRYGMEVHFSPDGTQLAVGFWGGAVQMFSFPDGRLLWERPPPIENWGAPLLYTPDGRSLLLFEPDQVHNLDASTGTLRGTWRTGRLEDLDVSRDGTQVVGRHSNRIVARWRLPSLKPIGDLGVVEPPKPPPSAKRD